MSPQKRQTVLVTESVLQRLNAYALAAGAAGVGIFAASPAQAKVVYTPVSVTVSLSNTLVYDLNPANAAVEPFQLVANFTSPASLYWNVISFNPKTSGARFVQGPGTNWSIAPLPKGSPIGPGRKFGGSRGFVDTFGPYGGGTFKNHDGFKFGQTVYIGFKFQISGQTHYGWARVKVTFDQNKLKDRLTCHLTGYAYETTPNMSIKAGQTSGPTTVENSALPQAASPTSDAKADSSNARAAAAPYQSLGLLALGVEGIPAWRRQDNVEPLP